MVFEKDTHKVALSLTNRLRTNPPPKYVNKELDENYRAQQAEIKDEPTARRLRQLLNDIEYTAF